MNKNPFHGLKATIHPPSIQVRIIATDVKNKQSPRSASKDNVRSCVIVTLQLVYVNGPVPVMIGKSAVTHLAFTFTSVSKNLHGFGILVLGTPTTTFFRYNFKLSIYTFCCWCWWWWCWRWYGCGPGFFT